jgi:hypothetical protein
MIEYPPIYTNSGRIGVSMIGLPFRKAVIILAVSIITAGFLVNCSSTKQTRRELPPAQIEGLLTTAGFQKNLADTPEKMEKIQALTQRMVVPHLDDGKVFYVYADAANCGCVYVGDELDYERFKDMVGRAETANPSCIDSRLRENSNWSSWGNLNSLCN